MSSTRNSPSIQPVKPQTTFFGKKLVVNLSTLVVVLSLLLLWVNLAHNMEEFIYGVGYTFDLSLTTIAVLYAAGFVIQISGILLADRGQRLGYTITMVTGAASAITCAMHHLHDVLFAWPYRAGIVSKALEVSIMLLGVVLTIASLWALATSARQRTIH
jgi:hypothetical protein